MYLNIIVFIIEKPNVR